MGDRAVARPGGRDSSSATRAPARARSSRSSAGRRRRRPTGFLHPSPAPRRPGRVGQRQVLHRRTLARRPGRIRASVDCAGSSHTDGRRARSARKQARARPWRVRLRVVRGRQGAAAETTASRRKQECRESGSSSRAPGDRGPGGRPMSRLGAWPVSDRETSSSPSRDEAPCSNFLANAPPPSPDDRRGRNDPGGAGPGSTRTRLAGG